MLHLHGGGFAVGALGAHVALAGHVAAAAGRRVLALDYRLAPEHPHPAALDDAEAAHAWLQEQGLTAGIALSGESAGGGLAVALLAAPARRGRRAAARRGAAVPVGRPRRRRRVAAPGQRRRRGGPAARGARAGRAALLRAPRRPTTRRCSPARADLRGLPPLLVQPGGAELLRDDAVAFAERARAAGVEVELDEVPGMWHVFQSAVGEFPEAGAAVARAGAFLRARLRAG